MNARRPLFATVAAVTVALGLSACFGSGSSGPPASLAVIFVTAPPTSDALGTTFQVSAEVSNNSKVNWTCAPSGACGSFNPTQTASGAATVYTPPAMVPAGGSVTIMAVSVQDGTKSASANVTITPGGTINVAFQAPAPPPSLTISGTAQLTATITSTVTNAVSDGVDWTATCTGATSGCGTFTMAHTASGAATTYNAPPTVPGGGLTVTVEAASTLDSANNVSGTVVVTATATSAYLCAGCSYTYEVSGEDSTGFFTAAGVFTSDGNGNITGGEQDFSDFAFSTGNTPDAIQAGSTYQFTSDGRGTITLNTGDAGIGVNGVETLGVAFVSPTHLLITELDQSATGSGTIDRQTVSSFSTSTLTGGFTFVSGGADLGGFPLGVGGVFNVDGPGNISGTGSTFDINDGGFFARNQTLTGSYTVSDQLGRIQLTIHSGGFGAVGLAGPIVAAGYITDATHVKFVEVDSNVGVSAGLAIGQGAATGTLSAASLLPAGTNYVFTTFGAIAGGPVAFATTFTSDGSANLQNGSSDVNAAGVPSSGSVTGTYAVDAMGTGRVVVNLKGNTIVGNPQTADVFAVYLTGGTDPPLALEIDGFGVTTGSLYTQAAGSFSLSSFKGSYGLNFTVFDPTGSNEADVSGQVFADGAGNLLGTMDINDNGTPEVNQAFTGNYAASTSGRFTGSVNSTATGTLGVSYFIISPTQLVFIETDTDNAVSLGLFQLQTPPF
ncbi:MAG TPA: hypothetical protein VLW54_08235 [Candidatus Acidoferrales bacterium]|nr:hypothetical protein [Candidatus Acidoferrales bacterium]